MLKAQHCVKVFPRNMNLWIMSPCKLIILPCNNLAGKKKKTDERHKAYQTRKSRTQLTKSNPTPLLTRPESRTQSKIQALEATINNLETTVKNGIVINDPQIFASLLETCFQLNAIDQGLRLKNLIPKKLLHGNVGISSKLLRLHACSGQLDEAHEMFDKMVQRNTSAFPWNSLISGYAEKGLYEDALALYFQMIEDGVEPDEYTFPRVLKACGGAGIIQAGEEVHRHVIRLGFWRNEFVLNALVDMYAKCGDIIRARKVFDNIEKKGLVSWNSMIMGYLRHCLVTEALDTLRWMIREKCEPDSSTLSSILTSVVPVNIGSQIHAWVLRKGIIFQPSIANSLIVFYSKIGISKKARYLFESMPEKDLVSWNSIISTHSKDSKALNYFTQMIDSDISPDDITFVSLLSACAHLRLVKEGERIYNMMIEKYQIIPSMEHYACVVNLYSRSGLIREAYEFITNRMEIEAGPTVWGALLYGCYLHGDVDLGEKAAGFLFEMEPDVEHNFELLIGIYEKAGRFKDVERIRKMMTQRGMEF